MLKRIESFFWYIFVFSLSFQTVWIFDEIYIQGEKWQYATGKIYFFEIVLFVLFCLLFLQKMSFSRLVKIRATLYKMIKKKIHILLWIFFIWAGLSIFWALDKEIAFKTFIHFVSGIVLWSILRWKFFSVKKTFYVFSIALCVHVSLGIMQWVQQYSPEISYLGMSEYQVAYPGISVLKNDFGRWLRVYGGFSHPNVFGGVLSIVLLISMFFYKEIMERREKIYFISTSIFFIWGMVFTFSRAAWLSFAVGWLIITVLSFFWKKWEKKQWFSWIFISGVIFISGTVFMFTVKDNIESRFSEEIITQEQSFLDRVSYVQQARESIQENIFLGVGIGNFTVWTQSKYWKEDSHIALFQPVHLVPLLIFAELGLVGFSLFFGIFISIFFKIVQQKSIFALGLVGSFCVLMFFDHWLWTSCFGLFFLFLMSFLGKEEFLKSN
ncbi:MAG: O-antigen ligase domain-containing protein [Candidatus Moranbacteria bacterium]|nr:O-antigen ligase domain-containing protein [Candidatus Moranbacteria bacterium]